VGVAMGGGEAGACGVVAAPASKSRCISRRLSRPARSSGVVLSLVVAVVLGGCGSGGAPAPGAVAVQVGAQQLSVATVQHWSELIASGVVVPDYSDGTAHGLRAQALSYLIGTEWVRGEVARRGLAPSRREVERGIAESGAAVPDQSSAQDGESEADLRFLVEGELAEQALGNLLKRLAPRVSEAEVRAFYVSHIKRYRVRERRVVDLVEGLPSKAAGIRLRLRAAPTASFGRPAFHETVERPLAFNRGSDKGELNRAIFSASPGVVSDPMALNDHYTLFVVRRVIPKAQLPLGRVRASITRLLAAEHSDRAVHAFLAGYRERWRALTNCRAGYVVQKCRQYRGASAPEEEPFDE
jgi:hypothetical protein